MILDILTMMFAGGFLFNEVTNESIRNRQLAEYMKRHRYNLARQTELQHLAYSNPDLFKEKYGIDVSPGKLKRECYWYLDKAIQKAVESEGFVYIHSYYALHGDPEYCEIMGIKCTKR